MCPKPTEDLPKMPTSDQDLVYTLPILWKILLHYSKIKTMSDKTLIRFKKTAQDYARHNETRQRIAALVRVDTVADYVDDAFTVGLDKYNYLYTADELAMLQEVTIQNPDGNDIKALILKTNRTKKWIIGVHGWTENKYLALRQTYLFAKLGFNVMTIDMRGHGASYGAYTDLGYSAPYDIASCVEYLKKSHDMSKYGLIGNSMGGSIAVKFAEDIGYLDPDLKFVIDDCGFSNLLYEIRYFFQRQTRMPWWQVCWGLRRRFRHVFGYDPIDFDIRKNLEHTSKIPMLFIHGEDDDMVPFYNSEQLYREKIAYESSTISMFLPLANVKHIEAISVGHKEYVNGIVQFLKRIKEIK